ncbi:acyltransferase family protein [Aeromonas rivipollensis]
MFSCCFITCFCFSSLSIKNIDTLPWNVANFIQSITRVCVPLFFMISGYVFMRDKEVRSKNILKIITNLVFYTTIYFVYVYFLEIH